MKEALREAWDRLIEAEENRLRGRDDPIMIPAWLYDAAVARDVDVTGYRKIRPIPTPIAASLRKSMRSEYPACMPAHGGKCAVCGTGDCLRRP
jgi:hypothetical protein